MFRARMTVVSLFVALTALLVAGRTLAQSVQYAGQIYDQRTPNASYRMYASSLLPGDTITVQWKASAGCNLTLALYDRISGAPVTDGRGPIVLVGNPTNPFGWNTASLPISVFARDAILSVRNPNQATGIVTYYLKLPRTATVQPMPTPTIAGQNFIVNTKTGTVNGAITLTDTSILKTSNVLFNIGDRTNFQTLGLIPIVSYKVGTLLPGGTWGAYPTFSANVKSITMTISTTNYGNTYTYASSVPIQ